MSARLISPPAPCYPPTPRPHSSTPAAGMPHIPWQHVLLTLPTATIALVHPHALEACIAQRVVVCTINSWGAIAVSSCARWLLVRSLPPHIWTLWRWCGRAKPSIKPVCGRTEPSINHRLVWQGQTIHQTNRAVPPLPMSRTIFHGSGTAVLAAGC